MTTDLFALRTFDALDLVIVEAMCVAALGPDSGLTVTRAANSVDVQLSPEAVLAVHALCTAESTGVLEEWVSLIEDALIVEVVERVGECWRPEVELYVGLSLALRTDDLPLMASACAHAPLTISTLLEAADIIAAGVASADLVELI